MAPPACSIPQVVLLEAHRVKQRVAVAGLARATLAGRRVTVEALIGSKRLGRAVTTTVGPDGKFAARLPLPASSKRARAQYRATIGDQRSRLLRLVRKMVIKSSKSTAAGTRVIGVIGGVARRWDMSITRQRCVSSDRIKTVRTDRKGRFSLLFPKPADTDPVTLYRARASVGRKRTFSEILLATVPPVRHPLLPADDTGSTDEDVALTIEPSALLANDSDPNGGTLTVASVHSTSATHGSVALTGGKVRYQPARDFNGPAMFEYTISDGHGNSAAAKVTVTVGAAQDAPSAVDDSASTDEDTAVSIPVSELLDDDSDPDGEALTVTSVTGGAGTHGTVALANAAVTYTPEADFSASASFQYTISDGHGGADTATVSMVVRPGQEPPVARDDAAETMTGRSLTISNAELVANDSDADGDTPTVTAVAQTPETHGTVTLAGGEATFSPDVTFTGDASFTYTVSDGHANSDTATVAVAVRAPQAPPAGGCFRPPSGLVAWYPADGDAEDHIGTADGSLGNGATFAAGIAGQAFAFDGLERPIHDPRRARPHAIGPAHDRVLVPAVQRRSADRLRRAQLPFEGHR